jgi:Family of unknown function (DUF5937)
MADDTTTRSPFGIEPPHPELERLQPLVGGWKVADHTHRRLVAARRGRRTAAVAAQHLHQDRRLTHPPSFLGPGAGSSNPRAAGRPTIRPQPNGCLRRRGWARSWAMIEITLAHSDLARVRFAHSPVEELVASLRVLQDPGRQLMYGRWVSATRGRLGGLRLDLLAALAPTGRYLPAFLFPPSTRPWGVLAEELAQVAASPPAVVRAELDKVREGGPLPGVLGPLYDDPAGQLPAVVEEMGRYWEAAIEPVWPRVRGLCAADLAYRMEQSPAAAWPGCWATCTPTSASPTSCSGSTSPTTAPTASTSPAPASCWCRAPSPGRA